MVLGYDYNRASDVVTKIYKEGMEVEELVKMALKSSMRQIKQKKLEEGNE